MNRLIKFELTDDAEIAIEEILKVCPRYKDVEDYIDRAIVEKINSDIHDIELAKYLESRQNKNND